MTKIDNLLNIFNLAWGLLWRTAIIWYAVMIILTSIGHFTGASLIYTNHITAEALIKLKPTFSELGFSLLIFTFNLGADKSIVSTVFGSRLHLTKQQWKRFDYLLIAALLNLGVLNAIVAYSMSTNAWVNYKVFGSGILYLISMFFIASWLGKAR